MFNVLKTALFVSGAVLLLLIDRVLKLLAQTDFFTPSVPIIKNIFNFSFAANYGIAFSVPFEGEILTVITGIIIIFLGFYLFFLYKKRSFQKFLFLTLLFLGAVSNFYDRINWGYVIDYWDLKYFTIFNLADVMIVAGFLGLLISYFFSKKS